MHTVLTFKIICVSFVTVFIVFEQTHQTISIPITNDMEFEKDENFEIELFDPEGGAKIGKVNRTAVTITNDDGK